jgi:hypothetical protein
MLDEIEEGFRKAGWKAGIFDEIWKPCAIVAQSNKIPALVCLIILSFFRPPEKQVPDGEHLLVDKAQAISKAGNVEVTKKMVQTQTQKT